MPVRFPLGQLFITSHAANSLDFADVLRAVKRHASGDWGDLCEEDRIENDHSLTRGYRLLSAYRDRNQLKFWIITEGRIGR